jgi:hypothetical protein
MNAIQDTLSSAFVLLFKIQDLNKVIADNHQDAASAMIDAEDAIEEAVKAISEVQRIVARDEAREAYDHALAATVA